MVTVKEVEKGSYAHKAGVLGGDVLVSVNSNEINDVLDYRYYTTEKKLTLSLLREEKPFDVKIVKKDEYDELGLEFETYLMDKQHSCRNGCIFCFIDQNPKGMRETIYFKDDDSRMSFFFGNYVTLTNLSECEVDRIIKMRISPVNISVHTTNPELRVKMMKNKNAGEVLRYLKKFRDGEIMMNCQIVLCKGINDGKELERSLTELSAYYPYVGSVAVVPAGLTAHRRGLFPLDLFDENDSKKVIDLIDRIRKENNEKYGVSLCYASDEWYLKAGLQIPCEEYYEDYPQIENGVGMIRSMENEIDFEIENLLLDDVRVDDRKISVVTGEAAYDFIKKSVEKITYKWYNISCNVYKAKNLFFGGGVTVAGLLTGSDLITALSGKELGDVLYIPAVMLRHEGDKFLDDMTLDELSQKLGVSVCPVISDGAEFVASILGL
ncbi:MAG: DUF512 domain-containing protein [Ruminococcaceae bacterium]|nr:DUF512 domain-containing protein [Oscillospiraceae bacterium]